MGVDELWDVKKTAGRLGLSVRTVYQMARDGRIPSIRVGGRWRFRPTDIDWWLQAHMRVPAGMAPPSSAPSVADPGELARFLSAFTSPLERRLAFVARLTTACQDRGWLPPVIVGGHAVEFYSAGGYATVDIDVVSASEPLDEILGSWGFERRGRHWIREDLGLVAEAPSSRLAPGQRDRLTQVQVAGATAYVLGLEDVIVDRLAACVHWSSENDCRWAEVLTTVHKDDLDVDYLRLRATEMEVADRLETILGRNQ
jgi:excisionase family DNA binding protein